VRVATIANTKEKKKPLPFSSSSLSKLSDGDKAKKWNSSLGSGLERT
jgi:hypothetical protein